MIIGRITNNINIQTTTSQRLGRFCLVERPNPRAAIRIKTLKKNAFATRVPALFNPLPKHLRNSNTSPELLKKELDKFLWTIASQPKLPHYPLRTASNSITDLS